MPGLVPGIHVFIRGLDEDVDGRDICANARVRRASRICPAMTLGGQLPTSVGIDCDSLVATIIA